MKKKLIGLVIALSLVGVGCSSTGNEKVKDKSYVSQNVKKGMTENEVRTAMGEPTAIDFQENGNIVWTYLHSTTKRRAGSAIPVAGAFIGGQDTEVNTLKILFDENGKVRSIGTTQTKQGSGSLLD